MSVNVMTKTRASKLDIDRMKGQYIKELSGGGVEAMDVNQGDYTELGSRRSNAVSATLEAVDRFGQGLEGTLVGVRGHLGLGGVAAGLSDLDIGHVVKKFRFG